MRFVDEFRDPAAARALLGTIERLAGPARDGEPFKFMEVCGGHTHTIYRHGIEHLLPDSVELVHGPGCPVCVIPMGRVDDAIAIAEHDDVILTTFGDMLRVPGGRGSFFDSKAAGADIRMVYSPLDALKVARKNPDKRVVFMAIGFETTAPSTAMTVLRAAAEGLENFSIFCNHVTIIPAIKAILDSPASSGRGTCRRSSGAGRTSSSRASTASRWCARGSSRWTSCSRCTSCSCSSTRTAARSRTSTPASCHGTATSGRCR